MANGFDAGGLGQALAQPQGGTGGNQFLGMDPDALRSLAFTLAQAIDPQGVGGRLAQGGRAFQQSSILAGEREQQQQGLQALGLTPQGVPGPTKMTIGADGTFTATGNLGGQFGPQAQAAAGGVATPQIAQTVAPIPQQMPVQQQAQAGLTPQALAAAQQPITPGALGGTPQVPFQGAQSGLAQSLVGAPLNLQR